MSRASRSSIAAWEPAVEEDAMITSGKTFGLRGAARFVSGVTPTARGFKRALGAIALFGAASLGFGAGEGRAEEARAEAAAPPPHVTLIAFGDSLIHGYGLPIEEGFVPQLQAWLDANGAGPVTVVNAGVSGDTTSGGLSRLDWSIGADADAVLLELGANDALRGVDPAITRKNLDAMLTRLGQRGLPVLLAGMRAPRNWGQEYVDAFEPIYADLAEKHDAPLYPFFLEGVVGERGLFQDDGLHPNKAGVAKIVAAIGPSVAALIETARAAKATQ